MAQRKAFSFCRICSGCCGMEMTIDDHDRIVSIRGDKAQPLTKGYACFKGLQADDAHHSPNRLLQPLKRMPDGSFAPISSGQALDEIAERMRGILEREGPDALALFAGNGSILNTSANGMHRSFMAAVGSKQFFTTLTIDQSAKLVSFERMGAWGGGLPDLEQSDVGLMFGVNPLVSHSATGYLTVDPSRRLKRAKARGFKLIMIDPRRTETARHADLFVQPVPGEDAAIAAGLLRIILTEGWHDPAFCETYVGAGRMAALRAAVEPFTPEKVADRARIEAAELVRVAEMFARDHKRGHAYASTGVNMAPFSNVAQHMIDCLNVVCGRFRQPGDRAPADMVRPIHQPRAEVIPAPRSWTAGEPSRIRGVGAMFGERMTGTLSEEILTPGPGQIRALIVDGANIAASLPDNRRSAEAFAALDLMVVIEPYMTATAHFAHYIIPPTMQYERADLPISVPGFPLVPDNWCQYAPAVLKPPAGADVVDDWYVFWSLAKRLGKTITYEGKRELDMVRPPTTDDLLAIRLEGGLLTLDELKQHPSGRMYDVPTSIVQRGEIGARFDVMPADVAEELDQYWTGKPNAVGAKLEAHRGFLLSSRRLRDVFCSNGTHLDSQRARVTESPVFMHPADMTRLDLASGDEVEVASGAGHVIASVREDDTMKPGVVSLAHGWGGMPDAADDNGPCVNRLIDTAAQCEAVNAMPWMSALRVDVRLHRRRPNQPSAPGWRQPQVDA